MEFNELLYDRLYNFISYFDWGNTVSTFGERLNILRQKRGLTQQDLADYFHISNSSISSYETGTRIPDITFLKDAAEFFEVSSDYLIGLSDSTLPQEILGTFMVDDVPYHSILERIEILSEEQKMALNILLESLYQCALIRNESSDPEKVNEK